MRENRDVARTEGGEVLEDDGLVDVVADSADEDGFLGLCAFLHRKERVVQSLNMARSAFAEVPTRAVTLTQLWTSVWPRLGPRHVRASLLRLRVLVAPALRARRAPSAWEHLAAFVLCAVLCFSAARLRLMRYTCRDLCPKWQRNLSLSPPGALLRAPPPLLCEPARFLRHLLQARHARDDSKLPSSPCPALLDH